jgi:hypothetical protein
MRQLNLRILCGDYRERVRQNSASITASLDAPHVLVDRVWLWLWRAERRRDELLGARS